jgi:hypothetical protein
MARYPVGKSNSQVGLMEQKKGAGPDCVEVATQSKVGFINNTLGTLSREKRRGEEGKGRRRGKGGEGRGGEEWILWDGQCPKS